MYRSSATRPWPPVVGKAIFSARVASESGTDIAAVLAVCGALPQSQLVESAVIDSIAFGATLAPSGKLNNNNKSMCIGVLISIYDVLEHASVP